MIANENNGGVTMEKKVLTAKDIKEITGLSLPTVYDLLNQEDCPSIRVGRRIIVPADSFEKFLMDAAANKTEFNTGR
jgi:excisionase family DNA binding protein